MTTYHTCQFWARSEPVNMLKTIEPPAKCRVRAVIRFLIQNKLRRMLSSGIVLVHDNARPHTAAATISSARTWLPMIFISFLLWNGRRRTTFWHNELQTGIENWLKVHMAGVYDEGIGKLVPRYEKRLRRRVSHSPTLSVALPTSQLILQPFHFFTYVTVHSPTLLSLLLHHKFFT